MAQKNFVTNRTIVQNSYSNMKRILFLLVSLNAVNLNAQETLTLDSCYAWARNNYPLIKRFDLINKTNTYNLDNIEKGNLPQISVSAQATYQSDVTSISIPNFNVPSLSKDQYKIYVDASKTLYDGGVVNAQKQLQDASSKLESAKIENDLYALKERIKQIYFGALLLKVQLEQNALFIGDLNQTQKKVQAAVNNGTAFKTDVSQIESEILLQTQKKYEIESGIASYLQMLSAFIKKPIDSVSQLQTPENVGAYSNMPLQHTYFRPELHLFEQQQSLLDLQTNTLDVKTKPRVSAFVQGGYGKPGFNLLKTDFDFFAIGGVRANWNLSSFYTLKNEKELLQISKNEIAVQKETFLYNADFSLLQQNYEKQKLQKLLQTDDQIVALKENIRDVAKAKFDNGVITLNDYLKEITAVNQAKYNRELHKIQIQLNEANRLITLGN